MKTKQKKLFKIFTKKQKIKRKSSKNGSIPFPSYYKVLYTGTRQKMYNLKKQKGRFLPKKQYVVIKYKKHFALCRKMR